MTMHGHRHRHQPGSLRLPARVHDLRCVVASLALTVGLLAVFPGGAGAECDPVVGTWPSFSEIAPSAPTIVTGEVIALLDTSRAATSPGASPLDSTFQLRVDDTLRGTSEALLTFVHGIVAPGSQCLSPLSVGLHDRLALAMSEPAGDAQPTVLAVGYLHRELATTYPIPDGLAISEAEVAAIAGRPVSYLPVLAVGGLILAAFLLSASARITRTKRRQRVVDRPEA